jgi:hypothetical protein
MLPRLVTRPSLGTMGCFRCKGLGGRRCRGRRRIRCVSGRTPTPTIWGPGSGPRLVCRGGSRPRPAPSPVVTAPVTGPSRGPRTRCGRWTVHAEVGCGLGGDLALLAIAYPSTARSHVVSLEQARTEDSDSVNEARGQSCSLQCHLRCARSAAKPLPRKRLRGRASTRHVRDTDSPPRGAR